MKNNKNKEEMRKKIVHEAALSTFHVSHYVKVYVAEPRCEHRCLFHLVISDLYSGDWGGQLVDGRESRVVHVTADKTGNFDVFVDDNDDNDDDD